MCNAGLLGRAPASLTDGLADAVDAKAARLAVVGADDMRVGARVGCVEVVAGLADVGGAFRDAGVDAGVAEVDGSVAHAGCPSEKGRAHLKDDPAAFLTGGTTALRDGIAVLTDASVAPVLVDVVLVRIAAAEREPSDERGDREPAAILGIHRSTVALAPAAPG